MLPPPMPLKAKGFESSVANGPPPVVETPKAQPFVKWAGGKRSLVSEIMSRLPHSFENYHEPFVGGGAVFFALAHKIKNAFLSDANADLIRTYRAIQEQPERLIETLQHHKENHETEGYYYEVRAQSDLEDIVDVAARFIYLNKTCYNGLYRVNKSGQFNVPQGRYKNPAICDADNIRVASRVLQKAAIHHVDFGDIEPEAGDLVYCDPPYDDTFNGYSANGFGNTEQGRLRDCMDRWHRNGCYVMLSNSDTPLIRDLYQDYTIHEVQGPPPYQLQKQSAWQGG